MAFPEPEFREDGTVQSGGPADRYYRSDDMSNLQYSSSPTLSSSAGSAHCHDQKPDLQANLGKKVSFREETQGGIGDAMARGRNPTRARGTHDDTGSNVDETIGILRAEIDVSRGEGVTKDQASGSSHTVRRPANKQSVQDGNQLSTKRRASARPDLPEKETSWLERKIGKYSSIELENKGSVARDHLALERTFLAWLRTSLSFASIGIAITQLFRLNTSIIGGNNPDPSRTLHHVGKPLGSTFIAISIIILFIGFHRYFESQHYVIRGKFPASRGSIVLVAFIAGALIVASLIVVLAIGRGEFEK